MRWVEVAAQRPHRCAVIPLIGAHQAKGFIDTGYDLHGWDPHVYVSVVAVEEMARMIGWVPPGDVSGHARALVSEQAKAVELEQRVAVAEERLAAVHTLKQAGYETSRKPGRPKKAPEKAVA